MVTPNVDAMVREGIRALRNGNKVEAQSLLLKAVELDQYNEDAWLWLSSVVDTIEERRTCLENVLVINPNNPKALQGMTLLESGNSNTDYLDAGAGSSGTSTIFDDSLPISSDTDLFGNDTSAFDNIDDQSEEYDDWIAGLGLDEGESKEAEPEPPASQLVDAPFDTSDFGFDADDDDGPFSSTPFSVPEADDDIAFSTPPPTQPQEPVMSPPPPEIATDDAPFNFSAASEDVNQSQESLEELGIIDNSNITRQQKKFDEVLIADKQGVTRARDIPEDEDYLSYLPSEIKATRLPGTDETLPQLVRNGLIAIGILNVVALITLVLMIAL